jgi:hypothetical protein
MISHYAEPIQNGLFLDPLNPMDGCKAVPFSKHGQAFQNLFGNMMTTIEYSSLILDEDSLTGSAF